MLFENLSPLQVKMIEKQIAAQFVAFEPRVALIAVIVDDLNHYDTNVMDVTIRYAILGGGKTDPIKESLRLTVGKVR